MKKSLFMDCSLEFSKYCTKLPVSSGELSSQPKAIKTELNC